MSTIAQISTAHLARVHSHFVNKTMLNDKEKLTHGTISFLLNKPELRLRQIQPLRGKAYDIVYFGISNDLVRLRPTKPRRYEEQTDLPRLARYSYIAATDVGGLSVILGVHMSDPGKYVYLDGRGVYFNKRW